MGIKTMKDVVGGKAEESRLPFTVKLSPCHHAPLTWISFVDDGEPHCTGYVEIMEHEKMQRVRCFKVYPRSRGRDSVFEQQVRNQT